MNNMNNIQAVKESNKSDETCKWRCKLCFTLNPYENNMCKWCEATKSAEITKSNTLGANCTALDTPKSPINFSPNQKLSSIFSSSQEISPKMPTSRVAQRTTIDENNTRLRGLSTRLDNDLSFNNRSIAQDTETLSGQQISSEMLNKTSRPSRSFASRAALGSRSHYDRLTSKIRPSFSFDSTFGQRFDSRSNRSNDERLQLQGI